MNRDLLNPVSLSILEAMISYLPDLVFVKNSKGEYILCNEAFAEFVGRPIDEIISKTDFDLFTEEIAAFFREHDESMIQSGKAKRNEEWVDYPNDERVLLDTLKFPFQNPVDNKSGVIGISRDITAYSENKAQLEKSNKRYSDIVDATGDWVWEIDKDSKFTFVSSQIEKHLGFKPEEIIGKTPFDLMPEQEAEKVFDQFTDILKNKKTFSKLTILNIHKSGAIKTHETTGFPVFDAEQNWIGFRGIDRDITLQKENELEIERRAALYEIGELSHHLDEVSILQSGLEWVENLTKSSVSFLHFINDDQETIELVTWSKRTLQTYCGLEQFETHYPISSAGIWADSFHTKKTVVVNDYPNYKQKKGLPEGHATLDRFISHPIVEGDNVRVLLGVGNKPFDYTPSDLETIHVLADYLWRIVSRKRLEKKLESETASRIELESVIDRSPAIVLLRKNSENYPITYISDNITDWGYTPDELISGHIKFNNIIDKRDAERIETEIHQYLKNDKSSVTQEFRIIRPDGSKRWIDLRTWVRKNKDGHVTHLESIGVDNTNRKDAERQLLQAQKAEALGNLAGGIAHDFNNMLLPIIALADITKSQSSDSPKIKERMEKIIEAGKNAQSLVSRLMEFSRSEDAEHNQIELISTLRDTLVLLNDTMPSSMDLMLNKSHKEIQMWGNISQIKSVMINIVKNAADALEGQVGSVQITISEENPLSLSISNSEQLDSSKEYVLISIKDNGPGIAENILARIFDPFFTTKPVGEGTGMGLAMVNSIIQQHGGMIYANSEVGKGTNFKIYLPYISLKH